MGIFGGLTKMKISRLEKPNDFFDLKINPAALSFNKEIGYTEDDVLGTSADVNAYKRHGPSTLNFDFILDSTGVAYFYEKSETIDVLINKFEKIAYIIDGNKHEPNKLKISWGNFTFICRLKSLKYDYSLFKPSGEPLRVKVTVSFINYIDRKKEEKEAKKTSPDLSHIIVLKAGESIPYWCNVIYGDSSYCVDIAKHNGLINFRNVNPGTSLMFPPLKRHG